MKLKVDFFILNFDLNWSSLRFIISLNNFSPWSSLMLFCLSMSPSFWDKLLNLSKFRNIVFFYHERCPCITIKLFVLRIKVKNKTSKHAHCQRGVTVRNLIQIHCYCWSHSPTCLYNTFFTINRSCIGLSIRSIASSYNARSITSRSRTLPGKQTHHLHRGRKKETC